MSIVNRAVKESKEVAELAKAAAKNELIEHLTPAIQAIIDSQMRRGALGADVAALKGEGVNRMRQADQGYDGITDFEEGMDMKKKSDKDKMESVAALFPGVSEVAEGDDMELEAFGDPDEGGEVAESADDDADDVDEDIELTSEELEAMYAEALQLEVDVKKGFSDMAKPHEFGAGTKGTVVSDPGGLHDLKAGEHEWDDEEPPAKKDWIPENVKRLVKQGLAENAALAEQNAQLRGMVERMHTKLRESNVLNAKILHVNKFLQAHGRLTAEQKKAVIESIDKGSTVKEVKSIYSILEASFRAAGTVTESAGRKPRADSQKARTSGAPTAKVLRESADKAETGGFGRWQQLAGLVNG